MKDNFNLKKFVSEGKIHSNIDKYKRAKSKLIRENLNDSDFNILHKTKVEKIEYGDVQVGDHLVLSMGGSSVKGEGILDTPSILMKGREDRLLSKGAIVEVNNKNSEVSYLVTAIVSVNDNIKQGKEYTLDGVPNRNVFIVTNMDELGLQPSDDEINSLLDLDENLEDVDGSGDDLFTDEEVEDILGNMEDNLDDFEGNSYDAEGY